MFSPDSQTCVELHPIYECRPIAHVVTEHYECIEFCNTLPYPIARACESYILAQEARQCLQKSIYTKLLHEAKVFSDLAIDYYDVAIRPWLFEDENIIKDTDLSRRRGPYCNTNNMAAYCHDLDCRIAFATSVEYKALSSLFDNDFELIDLHGLNGFFERIKEELSYITTPL